jgi:hypothetical protein
MKHLFWLLLLVSGIASAQSVPTGSKTRWANGTYIGTKLDAYFNAADSNAVYWRADSSLMAKYKGTARALVFTDGLTFVTLEQFGGLGNGSFDNSTAWTSAIATGKNIWLKPNGVYYSSASVTLSDYQVIQGGSGATMKFSGITAVNLGNYSKVIGVKFKGSKVTGSSSSEFAIKGHKKLGYTVSGCIGDSIATSFIWIDSTVTSSPTNTFTGAIVSDNVVYNSKVFIQLRERAEYIGIYNNIVNKCDTAISDIGGNNTINGGHYTENIIGYYANTNGINPAHNHIVGATFNHNDYNIYLENIPSSFGQNFVGSSFQVGDVYVKNSSTINFEACTFAFITGDSLVNDASKVTISNSNFRISIPYYEINGGTKKVRANNLLWSATQNEIDLWEGEIAGVLPSAKGGTGKSVWTTGTIPFVGSSPTKAFDGAPNYNLFFDSSYNALRLGNNANFYNEQLSIGAYTTPKITLTATGGYYWSTRVDGADNQQWKLRYENDNFDAIIVDRSHNVTIGNLGTGTVQATSGVLSVTSDGRLKNKLGYFTNASEAIAKLAKPQYWKYNAKSGLPKEAQQVRQFGLLADDVHKVLGEQFAPTQKDGYYGLSDRALLGLAIQAIQELKAEIERLKKK